MRNRRRGAVIAFAAAALQRGLAVGICAPTGEVAVAADAFVNSLLVKRVAVITLATPALADAALRVGDAARGGTSSAPIGIASARSDIDPVRAGIHPVTTMIARARTAIECVPIGTSRAAVHLSRARARHSAARCGTADALRGVVRMPVGRLWTIVTLPPSGARPPPGRREKGESYESGNS